MEIRINKYLTKNIKQPITESKRFDSLLRRFRVRCNRGQNEIEWKTLRSKEGHLREAKKEPFRGVIAGIKTVITVIIVN